MVTRNPTPIRRSTSAAALSAGPVSRDVERITSLAGEWSEDHRGDHPRQRDPEPPANDRTRQRPRPGIPDLADPSRKSLSLRHIGRPARIIGSLVRFTRPEDNDSRTIVRLMTRETRPRLGHQSSDGMGQRPRMLAACDRPSVTSCGTLSGRLSGGTIGRAGPAAGCDRIAVHAGTGDRPRRHGDRLSCPGYEARPPGRHQGPARGARGQPRARNASAARSASPRGCSIRTSCRCSIPARRHPASSGSR